MLNKKILILSVGYGKGHHSAAYAMAEHYEQCGWPARVVDVCQLAQPWLFRLTQQFYNFCVRRMPWLWGVTYALTDTADWSRLIRGPGLRPVMNCLARILHSENPDVIICTYPLFAYMLDELKRQRGCNVPYAVLVTDAREISQPWLRSEAPLVIVPDEGSRGMILERYAMQGETIVAAGFPVRRAFVPARECMMPHDGQMRVVYGAYRQRRGVEDDLSALLNHFPHMTVTVLAGRHERYLNQLFAAQCQMGRLVVLRESDDMPRLLQEHHLYIGKAGAATMFECYASDVPMIVNFTLPGQEQGNLELMLEDGVGRHVESTAHLVDTLRLLLADDAAVWRSMKQKLAESSRKKAAERIAQVIERKLLA